MASTQRQNKGEAPRPESRSGCIIALSNDDRLLDLIIQSIHKAGYESRPWLTADDALRDMTASPPDLIVVDFHLGDDDVLRLCQSLRSKEFEFLNEVPAIILVDSVEEETASMLADAGGIAFPRSLSGTDLLSAQVRSLVGERKQSEASIVGQTPVMTQPQDAGRQNCPDASSCAHPEISPRCSVEEPGSLNEERFRQASSMISDVLYSCETNAEGTYKINWMTGALERISGYTIEEVLSQGCWRFLVLEEDLPLFEMNIANLKPGMNGYCELRLRHRTGNILWVASHAKCQPAEEHCGGSVLYGCLLDITQRKIAEQALLESERKHREIVEIAIEGIVSLDANSIITFANERVARMLGCEVDELLGEDFVKFMAEDQRADHHRRMQERAVGKSSIYERRFRRKDGSVLWGLVSAKPRFDSEGRFAGSFGMITDVTDRIKAEGEAHDSASLLQTVIDHSDYLIYAKDLEGRFLFCSKSLADFFGKPNEELIGKTSYDFLPEEEANQHHANDLKVISTQSLIRIEETVETADGMRNFISTKFPLYNFTGEMYAVCGCSVDITNIRRAERDLSHSHDLMRYIIEHNRSAIAVHDKDLKYIYVSQRYLNDYDVKERNIIGKHHYEVFPELPPKWRDVHQRALNGEVIRGEDDPFVRTDGTVDWTRWECRPWFESDGSIGGIIVYTEVVTERKISEMALRKSEERYRTILQAAMDGFCILDNRGMIIEANDSYCRVSGYTRDEMLSMHISDLDTNRNPAQIQQHFREIMQTGEARFETAQRRKDGKVIDIEVSVQFRPVDGGQFIAFLRDISDQKAAQREKLRLEEQLIQSQKMESVGRLAGGVAHDFNNMLMAIIGYAEMSQDEVKPDSHVGQNLHEIRKAAERSADLTRQLLAFARKQTIAPKVMNLNDTVEGMLKMLRRLIGEDIDLVWKPASDIWQVKLDPVQIDQVLVNLTVNARDAISGVGKLTIETENVLIDEAYCASHVGFAPGEYVRVSVSDNGCGMDKETMAQIFEPFFTTKKTGEGTGLGLSTVFGIVRQNDGFINVYSEPEKGTTFAIYLPKSKGSAPSPLTHQHLKKLLMGEETILLVEDEALILELGRVMLKKLGYKVYAAHTPREAIQIVDEHAKEIDLLITDVVMPGMNGRDLAQAVQLLNPKIKCLFMSGYTANVIAHHGILDDGVAFIQKPYSIDALSQKVRQALGEA